MGISILQADLDSPVHQRAIVELTNDYAQDPMVTGKPLADGVLRNLIAGLREHPTTLVWLAFDGELPVGIATCFLGFSTFAARPLLNIHDLAVLQSHRGQGIGRQLLQTVEGHARQIGCCKLTLEVLENNPASNLYQSCGFAQAEYAPAAGRALFYDKVL